jgi:FkbM family methyltransferase
LAEPARCWHSELKSNRTSHIEYKCVWSESNKTLIFNEVTEAEFSTLEKFNYCDSNISKRMQGSSYPVDTLSLNDLLDKYNAPSKIDFLSIDTEGSEFDILKNFDFDKYSIKIITVEHNWTAKREKIFSLLGRHGYLRLFEKQSRWDDWYVKLDKMK